MVVKIVRENGGGVTLHFGAANVLRYFPKQVQSIELQLGELRIACRLEPEFWQAQPWIHDPRLSAWLQCKVLHQNGHRRKPAVVSLVPNGANSFRVEPLSLRPRSQPKAANNRFAQLASAVDAPKGPRTGIRSTQPPFPPQPERLLPGGRLLAFMQVGS